jgi:hypothetical protein
VPHRVAQRFIRNIHRRFHADIFAQIGILVNVRQSKSVFRLCSNWNLPFSGNLRLVGTDRRAVRRHRIINPPASRTAIGQIHCIVRRFSPLQE